MQVSGRRLILSSPPFSLLCESVHIPVRNVERLHGCSDTRPRRWGVCRWAGSGEVETFVMVFYTVSNKLNDSFVVIMGLSCSCLCDGYIEHSLFRQL